MKTLRAASLLSSLIVMGSICLVSVSCKKEQQTGGQQAAPQTTVEVTKPVIKDIPVYKSWIGSLNGKVNATIRAQVTGYLVEQCYHNGQVVKKDQELFKIDRRTFDAALAQAEASLVQAKASLAKNEKDVERYTPLVETNAVSRKQLDDAIQATKEAKAAVEAAQAAVDSAKLNSDFTNITSPIDGIAGIAKAQIGDLVGQSGPVLAEVSSVNPIKIDFAITEQDWLNTGLNVPRGDYSKATSDMGLEIILATGDTYEHKAIPVAINREVNTSTGTINIEAEAKNPSYLLRPGMFIRVRAQVDVIKNALVVPSQAVIPQQGSYYVITVDEQGHAGVVPVKPGDKIGREQVVTPLIEGGLTTESTVVVVGTLRAMMAAPRPGQEAVEVLKTIPYEPKEPKPLMSIKKDKKDSGEEKNDTVLNVIPQNQII